MQFGRDFKPYLLSARNIFLKCGYTALCVIGLVLIIHVCGCVLFHYFKTRRVFPVRQKFVSHHRKSDLLESAGMSDEDEGEDSQMKTYVHSSMADLDPNNTNSLSGNFKYSETKV